MSTTDELDRISREKRPDNSTPHPQAARGGKWGQGGGTYLRPKDSNAVVGVRDRATGKALEGADRETDRQTNRLSAHYSKIDQSVFALSLISKWPIITQIEPNCCFKNSTFKICYKIICFKLRLSLYQFRLPMQCLFIDTFSETYKFEHLCKKRTLNALTTLLIRPLYSEQQRP